MFVLIISFAAAFWPMISADSCSAAGNVFDGPYRICKYTKPTYKVIEKPLDWHSAFWDCQLQGMEMATILSEQEEKEMEKFFISYKTQVDLYEGFWIAAATNDDGDSLGSFRWFTTGQLLNETYHKFAKGEPNYKQERCVHTYKAGNEWFWNNAKCQNSGMYICQTKKSPCA